MKSLFSHDGAGRFKIPGLKFRFIIIFTFLTAFTLVSANAQESLLDKRISISLNQVALPDALAAIAEKAGCTFSYSSTALPSGRQVSIQRNDITLTAALKEVLGNSLEKLQAQGNKVLIVLKKRSGSVKGVVKTSDGKPAEFVTVSIKDIAGTTVDKDGNYQLKNIPEGNYMVTASFIGLGTQMKQVTIEAGQSAVADFVLSENSAQLNEVVIRGNKQNKFANKQSDQVARLPLDNLETPQVYNVVTNAIIKERNITNYAEVFYNTPAVTPPSITYSNGNEYFLRGFYSSSEFRDGLNNYTGETEDPVNLERVEVLKGPSATLFGTSGGSFGGVINNVTKVPFEYTRGEVSYTGGSFGLSRFTLDYNTPLNKDTTVLFRINAARHWEESFQDYGFKHTYTVAPTVLYKVNDRLTLRLSGEFYQQNSTMWQWFYFGPDVTIKNIKDLKVPYNRSSAGDQMTQSWSTSRIFANADYKISDHWKSSTNFVQSIYSRPESYYMNGNEYINDSTLTRYIMGARPQRVLNFQFQQNFTGDFKIGKMRNRLVLGLDVSSAKYNSTFVSAYQDTVVMNDPSSKVNVSREKILNSFNTDPSDSHYVSSSLTASAYASDVLNFTDRLLAMLSLRVDHFDNKNSVNNGITQTDGYQQTALSPKLGLVYQVVKDQVSLFGNYMNGFSNNAPQLDGTRPVTYKPSQANQWEGGIKSSLFGDKLSATISYYNIDVKNALRSIPSSVISIQDGTQKSKGMEIELIANPLTGLNLMAGYGYNDAKYINANSGQDGKLIGSPKNIANFYASYKLTDGGAKGLGIGFGGNYVGASTYNDPVLIPSYFICNTQVMYDQPKFGLSFKVNNLANEKYWSWNFIQSQPTRNYVASLTYKF